MTYSTKYRIDDFRTKILSMMTSEQNIIYDDLRTKISSMMTLSTKYRL